MTIASSIPRTGLEIRLVPFVSDHIPDAVRLSREAGWPHRVEDWALTLHVARGVVALKGDELIGTALCSTFGEVAALNMIIVAQRHRGQGLGRRLMDAIFPLAEGLEQRLTATHDGYPLYEKLGFQPAYRILQHQGIARAVAPEQAVRTGTRADIPAFAAADLDASGMDRAMLLESTAETGGVLTTEGGFALLRKFGKGDLVGPVVARSDAAARSLVAEAACRCAGGFLRIDLPEPAGLYGLSGKAGLVPAGGGVAMSRYPRAAGSASDYRTFALLSQAFG